MIEYIETKVEKSVERNVKSMATKDDLSKLREELTITKSDLKIEIANTKSEMLCAICVVGLVQFLAIVGSVIASINFLPK